MAKKAHLIHQANRRFCHLRRILARQRGKAIKVDHSPVLLDWQRQSQRLGVSVKVARGNGGLGFRLFYVGSDISLSRRAALIGDAVAARLTHLKNNEERY